MFFSHNYLAMHTGEMFIEMVITMLLFMCGFFLRVHKNCFFNDVLTVRIHGLVCGMSPALAIYLLVIHP